MQQKYSDQGRSRALLTTTCLIFRARSLLRLGREAKKCVDLSRHKKLARFRRLAGDPMDVAVGVETDMRRHGGQEDVLVRAQARHADALAFQIRDAADALVAEQFKAADVDASQERDRIAGGGCYDQRCHKVRGEIDDAARDCLRSGGTLQQVDIANIGKTLGAEQLVGDVLRGDADAGGLGKADSRGFEGSLGGQRARRAQEARGAGE
jgi:hypothetical protein